MMGGKYYPVIRIGTFDDCHAALASVGITAQPADMIVADARPL